MTVVGYAGELAIKNALAMGDSNSASSIALSCAVFFSFSFHFLGFLAVEN